MPELDFRLCLLMFCSLGLSACNAGAEPAPSRSELSLPSEGFWKHWGDGKAEIAGYQLTQPRYGENRSGEAVLITVTEDFTRAGRVKSDGGHFDEYAVVKLNEIRDWQTGVYDYNVMTSTFLPLDGSARRGLPTKISFSSQEWCGHIWEQLRVDDSAAGRTMHSYFDGEADGYESLPIPEGGYFADTIPLLARGLVGEILQPGESAEVPWLRSALARRLRHEPTLWGRATLTRSADLSSLEVPAGRFDVERWTAKDAQSTTTWFVESAPPRRLIAWEVSDGERAELSGIIRSSYWTQNKSGDETLRRKLGLSLEGEAQSPKFNPPSTSDDAGARPADPSP